MLGSAEAFDASEGITGQFVLPATHTYLVRLQGVDETQGRGGYRLAINLVLLLARPPPAAPPPDPPVPPA